MVIVDIGARNQLRETGMPPEVYDWLEPAMLRLLVDVWEERLGNAVMHRPGKQWRESFVAARFGEGRADQIRLLPESNIEPTPDFAIRKLGVERRFEITEADTPGRSRGDEYPLNSLGPPPGYRWGEEWTSPADYRDHIRRIVEKKASKLYSWCDGLIIVANAFPVADYDQMTTEWWRSATEAARHQFSEVHLAIRSTFLPIWLNGEPGRVDLGPPESACFIEAVLGPFPS